MAATRGVKVLWRVLGAVAVFAVAVVLVVVFVYRPAMFTAYSSSPTAERSWAVAEYDRLAAPVATPRVTGQGVPDRYVPALLGGAELTLEDGDPERGELRLESRAAEADVVPDYGVIPVDEGSGFAFSHADGSGRLVWMGAKTSDPEEIDRDGSGGDYGYLNVDVVTFPELEPVEGDEALEAIGIRESDGRVWTRARESDTAVKLHLELDGFEDVKWKLRGFYDRATKVELSSGGSWTSYGQEADFSSRLECLHDARVRAVIDFAHGPAEVRSLPAREGEVVETDDYRVEVVAIVHGESDGWSSGGDGTTEEVNFRFRSIGGEQTTVLYSIAPQAMADAITLRATRADGEVLRSHGSGGNGAYYRQEYAATPDEMAELGVVFRPHFKRLLIDLPNLPGVPAENVGVADLFDCVVPYGHFDDESKLRRFVAERVQLELWATGSAFSPGGSRLYPLTVEGMTVREILGEYRASRPDVVVRVDEAAQWLIFEDPVRKTWWDRVVEPLKRLF